MQALAHMPLFSAVLLGLSVTAILSFSEWSFLFAESAHWFCNSLLPKDAEFEVMYSALVCGRRLSEFELKELLKRAGLIHLFVVSGAHLIFIDRLLAKLLPMRSRLHKAALITFILFLYAHMTLLNAPVLRSFFAQALRTVNEITEWNLTALDRLKLSIGFTLVVRPELWNSFSLLLSVAATLALSLAAPNRWRQALSVYIVMCLFLAGFGAPPPESILYNLVFTPLFAWLYFPMTWLLIVLPFLSPLVDAMWSATFFIFQEMSRPIEANPSFHPVLPPWVLMTSIVLAAELYKVLRPGRFSFRLQGGR